MVNSAGQAVHLDETGTTSRRVSNFPKFAQAFDAEPERRWQQEVQKHIVRLAKLDRGWDTYDAPPIGVGSRLFALSILNDFMRSRTPIPQVVPSTAGGVQLEWHQKGIDLEIHVTGPYKCEIWFKDHTEPNEPPVALELMAPEDYTALRKPFDLLTKR